MIVEQIVETVEVEQDGWGRDVSLLRHDEYRESLYSVAWTNRDGEAVHSILFWTREEAKDEMWKRIREGA